MTKEPFQMTIDELLINAIHRRNAASCHEIQRRQVQTNQSLSNFLLTELQRSANGGGPVSQSQENGDPDLQADVNQTWAQVKGVLTPNADIDTSDSPDPICMLAREMLAFDPPYVGQDADNSENAEKFIYGAADDPRITASLPSKGLAFWRWACVQFKAYRSKHRRGR